MKIQEYIELKYLLDNTTIHEKDHNVIRSFGKTLKGNDIEKLVAWSKKEQETCGQDMKESVESVVHNLQLFKWTIIVIMLTIGFVTGTGLLDYSNSSHVNITWFFVILIFIPFLFSLYTFYHLIKLLVFKSEVFQKHLIIKTILKIFEKIWKPSHKIFLEDKVIQSISLVKLQQGSLSLLLGTSLTLLFVLIGKYVAFGWESTLMDASHMQKVVNIVSYPWHSIVPSAVPTLDLIQNTNYSLIENLASSNNTSNHVIFNSWWKFLAMSLIVWGFIPRGILLYLANKNKNNTLKKSILSNKNVETLLKYMNEDIEIISPQEKQRLATELKKNISKIDFTPYVLSHFKRRHEIGKNLDDKIDASVDMLLWRVNVASFYWAIHNNIITKNILESDSYFEEKPSLQASLEVDDWDYISFDNLDPSKTHDSLDEDNETIGFNDIGSKVLEGIVPGIIKINESIKKMDEETMKFYIEFFEEEKSKILNFYVNKIRSM